MSIPSSMNVDGSYEVQVNYSDVDCEGTVTINPEDVLDELDASDVADYYKENGKDESDTLQDMASMKLIDTNDVLEFLKDEQMRGAFANINIDKILEELQR